MPKDPNYFLFEMNKLEFKKEFKILNWNLLSNKAFCHI